MTNKTILVTGGTGSFGQKFTKIVCESYKPKSVRIYSRSEYSQYQMAQKLRKHQNKIRYFIGDVRDKDRLERAMNNVDIVVHAAALKQILTAEYNPLEAVKTNISGTMNVIDAAINNNVSRAILISTDKAVNPINLYGATKLCAEKLFIQANSYTGPRKTKFSCVRYGNVFGSRGSVVPLFYKQKKTGTLTITHQEMTRFWITLEQGVSFVIQGIMKMRGGEIFIPKLPSVKIIDLARAIAPKAKIKIIGINPGEKLHEVLLSTEETRYAQEMKNYYLIKPAHRFWMDGHLRHGKKLKESYRSDTNTRWLTPAQVKKILEEIKDDYLSYL